MNLGYDNNQIAHVASTEFLGIVIKNSLSWKLCMEQIMSKLSAACYAIRSVKQHISHEKLKMVYYSYFHSVMLFMGGTLYIVSKSLRYIHSVFCLTTGPKPPPKRCLHTV